jgi:putative lipoprotein
MKTIKGTIVSKTPGKPFEPNTTAQVSVIDCSLACAPSRTLGKQVLSNLESFPLNFQVEFNDEPVLIVAVQIRIETGERLDYINDTRFAIKNQMTGEYMDSINVHVIPVGN